MMPAPITIAATNPIIIPLKSDETLPLEVAVFEVAGVVVMFVVFAVTPAVVKLPVTQALVRLPNLDLTRQK